METTKVQQKTPPDRVGLWTVANQITFFRILLTIPFLLLVSRGRFGLALVVFFVASVTDFFDGYFARRLGQSTRLGRFLDPAADKLLTTSSFVVLAFPHGAFAPMPVWLVVLVVGRDLVIVLGACIVYLLTGFSSFKPNLAGKINTALELALVVAFLVLNSAGFGTEILPSLYWLVALSVATSGVTYLVEGVRMLIRRAP
ncbi:MAG TPA: CDP-alcohol phosphatidyltransferase family protein [Blastocatellia bacterium]|nr:CDP-alcohol phosphatidyltransferase family protein [Blastocatellia bacterium]